MPSMYIDVYMYAYILCAYILWVHILYMYENIVYMHVHIHIHLCNFF